MSSDATEPGYPEPGKLEMIWGEGFLSPGGADEIARLVGGNTIDGQHVLDIGIGLGGSIDFIKARNQRIDLLAQMPSSSIGGTLG